MRTDVQDALDGTIRRAQTAANEAAAQASEKMVFHGGRHTIVIATKVKKLVVPAEGKEGADAQ